MKTRSALTERMKDTLLPFLAALVGVALLTWLAGCAAPVSRASTVTLEVRQAAHAAALSQALETLREAKDWQNLNAATLPIAGGAK